MKERETIKLMLPDELFLQIEELYNAFVEIQKQAAGIAAENKVPDDSAHLQDVLKSTEEATHNILDCATSIQSISDRLPAEEQDEINKYITRIYEACNFQDITGQQIKRVLKNLSSLEDRVRKLGMTTKMYAQSQQPQESEPSLLNGPQLSAETPNQDDVDKLFRSL